MTNFLTISIDRLGKIRILGTKFDFDNMIKLIYMLTSQHSITHLPGLEHGFLNIIRSNSNGMYL